MKESYRLPDDVLMHAQDFAVRFLPKDLVDLPVSAQTGLNLFPCRLKWVQTSPEKALEICITETCSLAPEVDPDILAIPDITFLTANKDFGVQFVSELELKGIHVIHTFGRNQRDSRKKKMAFYMGGCPRQGNNSAQF